MNYGIDLKRKLELNNGIGKSKKSEVNKYNKMRKVKKVGI